MSLKKEDVFISEADYLHEEHHITEFKNEYVDGYIYAMVGESANHHRLSGNLSTSFHTHLKELSCEVFQSGFKVKVGTRYFYPDVLVRCDNADEYYTEKPTIVIEVLSPSTFKYDRSFKVNAYKKIPSLVECVIIEQNKCFIEVHQRVDENTWGYAAYGPGDDVHFESIGLTLSVEEIYTDVDNLEL